MILSQEWNKCNVIFFWQKQDVTYPSAQFLLHLYKMSCIRVHVVEDRATGWPTQTVTSPIDLDLRFFGILSGQLVASVVANQLRESTGGFNCRMGQSVRLTLDVEFWKPGVIWVLTSFLLNLTLTNVDKIESVPSVQRARLNPTKAVHGNLVLKHHQSENTK